MSRQICYNCLPTNANVILVAVDVSVRHIFQICVFLPILTIGAYREGVADRFVVYFCQSRISNIWGLLSVVLQ